MRLPLHIRRRAVSTMSAVPVSGPDAKPTRQRGNTGTRPPKFIAHGITYLNPAGVDLQIPVQAKNHKSDHLPFYIIGPIIKNIRHIIAMELAAVRMSVPKLPVVVTLTRYGPKKLDSHDNLKLALSPVTDEVARFYEVPDDHAGFEWRFEQSRPNPYGVGVRIVPAGVERAA
jgi:hypothetical protein